MKKRMPLDVTVPRTVLLASGRLSIAAMSLFRGRLDEIDPLAFRALRKAVEEYDREIIVLMDKPKRRNRAR